MRIVRIPPGDRRILKPLQKAWQAPDEQDVPTEDIINWLRRNIHRKDIALWVVLDNREIIGAMLAFGPDLLQPYCHIYTAWLKKGSGVDSRKFFEGDFVKWVRSTGAQDITICSSSHSGRAWERAYQFKPYTRMYIKRLETVEELENQPVHAKALP